MLRISDESYERVAEIIEDIGYCCATEDDYTEWEDIAAFSVNSFMDELDTDRFRMTCEALREYIEDKYYSDKNMALGVKTAFERYLRERIDYLDGYAIPNSVSSLNEGEELEDTDIAVYRRVVKRQLEIAQNMDL